MTSIFNRLPGEGGAQPEIADTREGRGSNERT